MPELKSNTTTEEIAGVIFNFAEDQRSENVYFFLECSNLGEGYIDQIVNQLKYQGCRVLYGDNFIRVDLNIIKLLPVLKATRKLLKTFNESVTFSADSQGNLRIKEITSSYFGN